MNRCKLRKILNLIKQNLKFKESIHFIHKKAHINGEWVDAISGKTFNVLNPANGEVIGTVPDMGEPDCKLALASAKTAFETWKYTTSRVRAGIMKNMHNLIEKHSEKLAKLITLESGKPLVEARGEIIYGNSFMLWYAEEAMRLRGEIIPSPRLNKKLMMEKEPAGVGFLVTTWNFPLCGLTRKLGAALAAGCTCIVKPAEETPLTSLALAELAVEAGLPNGVFNVVTCSRQSAPGMAKYLLDSPIVSVISFSGSTTVGKEIYAMAANGIKRLSLQLGGDCPFIVFKSADIRKAATGAMEAKFRNGGQTCVSANRFLVQEEVHDTFVNTLKQHVGKLKIGDGMDESTQIGPLIHQVAFNNVADLVSDAIEKGAKVIIGGRPSTLGGYFYEPTILIGITPNMRIYHTEIFGPVVAITTFKEEQEAIIRANDSLLGLAGYVYSEDMHQIFRVVRQLDLGMVGLNDGMISLAEAPFGGTKQSGIGREGSTYGLCEFINIKFVSIGDMKTSTLMAI